MFKRFRNSAIAPKFEQRFLRAENVCLTLPTHGRVSSATENFADASIKKDERIVRDSEDRIVGIRVLENISFNLENGDRLAIIGANGSGKTSLLQVLSGAIPPDSGRVVCCGEPTSLININLGMQLSATGHRNITLRGLASGFSQNEIEQKRDEIAKFTELGDFLHLPVSTYSSGMRMRLSFAIVTSFNPEILILDEWLSAGDSDFREKASERMENFAQKAGIVVLASHNKVLLERTCNKAIFIHNGQLFAAGNVQEVYHEYQRAFRQKR